jgi:hypothetical protein
MRSPFRLKEAETDDIHVVVVSANVIAEQRLSFEAKFLL